MARSAAPGKPFTPIHGLNPDSRQVHPAGAKEEDPPQPQIPLALIEQAVLRFSPEEQEFLREALAGNHLVKGQLLTTRLLNGKVIFELADPKDPDNRIRWQPGASPEGQDLLSEAAITRLQHDLVGVGAGPDRLQGLRGVLSSYLYLVERISGEGFNDANLRAQFQQVILETETFAPGLSTAEVNELMTYLEDRMGLDRVRRTWFKAAVLGDPKAIETFYTESGEYLNKDRIDRLIASVPGVAAAINSIRTDWRGRYFRRDVMGAAHDAVRDHLVNNHVVATPQEAEIAVTLAERMLQVGKLEGERHGGALLPARPGSEAEQKLKANLGGNVSKLWKLFTGEK